jgi:tetratricopeptide (TPR) repeat protein
VIVYLKKHNRKEIVDNILKILSERLVNIEPFTDLFYRSRLKIASMIVMNQDEFVRIAERVINNKGEYINNENDKHNRLLIEFYNVVVNKGHLQYATLFASKYHLYDLEIESIVDNYYNIIYPLLETGQFELAEKIYDRCRIDNAKNCVFINWSGFIFQSWYELKSHDLKHLEKGLCLYEQGGEMIDKKFGVYSIIKYENLENLGYTYGLKGNYEKSLHYLNQAITIVSKTYQSEITYKLGNLYGMKAATLNQLKKYSEALEYTFKSDECKLLQVGPISTEMAWNHHDRAKIYLNMGNVTDARKSMIKAFEIRKITLGEDNGLTIHTRNELAKLNR